MSTNEMMHPQVMDIGDNHQTERPITHPLGTLRAWAEFAASAVLALARVASGKDRCAETIEPPPEIEEPVIEDASPAGEGDDAR